MAEIKLESLQSQLNSHFIFNSLNAIQNYIFTNEEVKANEYLSKFSRLIRGYLEASKNNLLAYLKKLTSCNSTYHSNRLDQASTLSIAFLLRRTSIIRYKFLPTSSSRL